MPTTKNGIVKLSDDGGDAAVLPIRREALLALREPVERCFATGDSPAKPRCGPGRANLAFYCLLWNSLESTIPAREFHSFFKSLTL